MSNIKQVIVVRKDLNMRKGKIAAQTAHASMKVILDNLTLLDHMNDTNEYWTTYELSLNNEDPLLNWIRGSFTKVVVSCDSLEELDELYKKAQNTELYCSYIVDNGYTEFNEVPTPTCIAIGPAKSEDVDKITGHLKLI